MRWSRMRRTTRRKQNYSIKSRKMLPQARGCGRVAFSDRSASLGLARKVLSVDGRPRTASRRKRKRIQRTRRTKHRGFVKRAPMGDDDTAPKPLKTWLHRQTGRLLDEEPASLLRTTTTWLSLHCMTRASHLRNAPSVSTSHFASCDPSSSSTRLASKRS